MDTYEDLLGRVGEMPRAASPGMREVRWLTKARVVGLARTHENRVEIFLRGAQLSPMIQAVREAIEFGPWYGAQGTETAFLASRLMLPGQGHFDQVAAFVCAELLRNGAEEDLASGFRATEPLIGLLFERLRLSDGFLVGLAGELMVLRALAQQAADEDVAGIVEGWRGWQRSLRDVTVGSVGVEVKTTSRSWSSHQIQGTHQVELNDGEAGGMQESHLFLVSIGLQRSEAHSNTVSLPSLVESLLQQLRDIRRDDVAESLLHRIHEYGSASGFGYDHLTMSGDPGFNGAFEVKFVRGYDMVDPNIAVLRRGDVVGRQHVDADSLRYILDLPLRVTGDLNPVVGLQQVARTLLATAGKVQ